ncbi:hypothetical protein D3C72_1927890 [compost metagenome]
MVPLQQGPRRVVLAHHEEQLDLFATADLGHVAAVFDEAVLCNDRPRHRIHMRLQFRRRDQQDAGQCAPHSAQRRDHHQHADERQDGRIDVRSDPRP